MNATDVQTAITAALLQGGQTWLIASIVAFLPALWTMALMMHLGRPYVLRTLRRIGLRLGADVWWMSYLLIRDALLLITFGLSFIFFNPSLVANLAFPITAPLAALFLLLALGVKLARRVDDDVNAFRLATVFLVIGASLYYIPLVFAVEAASQDYLAGFAAALYQQYKCHRRTMDYVDLTSGCSCCHSLVVHTRFNECHSNHGKAGDSN